MYKNGEFRYILDFYDQLGIRHRETLPEGTTQAKAKEKLRHYENQVCKKVFVPESSNKLFEQIASDWLAYKKPNVRASSWSVLDGHIRNHLSEFAGMAISRITTKRIEKWIAEKRSAGTHILTLRKILTNLGQIFSYASRHKYIEVNPMLSLERLRAQGDSDTPEMKVLNHEQIRALLATVTAKPKYHALFMLAIFSGARQGELLGLKWSDILWETNQISICRSFNNRAFYDTKTAASVRRIDLGAEVMLELKKWRIACPPNNLDLVFPNADGNPMEHRNMKNRHFFPALKEAGIDQVRFHDLRHTYASLKIDQGANIKYLSFRKIFLDF
jgi:integrase